MSTSETPRPSLDDTLARIDAVLTEHPSWKNGYAIRAELVRAHRRSCQQTAGLVGPDCPGCAAVDADFAIARNRATILPPPPPGRGWLARTLRRLFT